MVWCTGFADTDVRTTATELLGHRGESSKADDLDPADIAARPDASWGVDSEREVRGGGETPPAHGELLGQGWEYPATALVVAGHGAADQAGTGRAFAAGLSGHAGPGVKRNIQVRTASMERLTFVGRVGNDFDLQDRFRG